MTQAEHETTVTHQTAAEETAREDPGLQERQALLDHAQSHLQLAEVLSPDDAHNATWACLIAAATLAHTAGISPRDFADQARELCTPPCSGGKAARSRPRDGPTGPAASNDLRPLQSALPPTWVCSASASLQFFSFFGLTTLLRIACGLRDHGPLIPGEPGKLARNTPNSRPSGPRTYWAIVSRPDGEASTPTSTS